MDQQMNKEQVIEATIEVLANTSVPVRLKGIAQNIEGAINNLVIVLQMIRAENEMRKDYAAKQEDEEPAEEPEPDAGELFELKPEDVGCPEDPEPGLEPLVLPVEKEGDEDGRNPDAE